jgi:hypothetical protein
MAVVSAPVQEKVAVFGEARGLVGVLTLPAGEPAPQAPHALLLTTGILHRVGTGRLWVSLARALGAAGFATLRFDYSGIGDSERRRDVASMRESVARDIADACAYLSKTRGAERFVLIGLCSGAYDALLAAQEDRRVGGIVMIDMPGPFLTWRHTAHHLLARALRPASWKNPLEKLRYHSRMLLPTVPEGPDDDVEGYVFGGRHPVARARMRDQFARLQGRRVGLYAIFTAGIETNYNHRSQFREVFPAAASHPTFSYDFFPDSDHGFSGRAHRAQLIDGIVRWVRTVTP